MRMATDDRLLTTRFPRASLYHPEWVIAHASGGANSLWLAEWLTTAMDLRPGMRVLDLGCGRASSSIFLHREFGVQLWATDLWFSAGENFQRIRDAGVAGGVFPLHADARSLPFAREFLTLSHSSLWSADSLSRSCSGDHLSRSHQRSPSGQGTPRIP